MPRRAESARFAVACTDPELRRHLRVCANSAFRVTSDPSADTVSVHDGGTLILHAAPLAGGWLVRLHRSYYRHPLGPPSDGDAPPGVG